MQGVTLAARRSNSDLPFTPPNKPTNVAPSPGKAGGRATPVQQSQSQSQSQSQPQPLQRSSPPPTAASSTPTTAAQTAVAPANKRAKHSHHTGPQGAQPVLAITQQQHMTAQGNASIPTPSTPSPTTPAPPQQSPEEADYSSSPPVSTTPNPTTLAGGSAGSEPYGNSSPPSLLECEPNGDRQRLSSGARRDSSSSSTAATNCSTPTDISRKTSNCSPVPNSSGGNGTILKRHPPQTASASQPINGVSTPLKTRTFSTPTTYHSSNIPIAPNTPITNGNSMNSATTTRRTQVSQVNHRVSALPLSNSTGDGFSHHTQNFHHSGTGANTVQRLKAELCSELGSNSAKYTDTVKLFLTAKLTKREFDIEIQELLTKEQVQLHNLLMMTLLQNAHSASFPQPGSYNSSGQQCTTQTSSPPGRNQSHTHLHHTPPSHSIDQTLKKQPPSPLMTDRHTSNNTLPPSPTNVSSPQYVPPEPSHHGKRTALLNKHKDKKSGPKKLRTSALKSSPPTSPVPIYPLPTANSNMTVPPSTGTSLRGTSPHRKKKRSTSTTKQNKSVPKSTAKKPNASPALLFTPGSAASPHYRYMKLIAAKCGITDVSKEAVAALSSAVEKHLSDILSCCTPTARVIRDRSRPPHSTTPKCESNQHPVKSPAGTAAQATVELLGSHPFSVDDSVDTPNTAVIKHQGLTARDILLGIQTHPLLAGNQNLTQKMLVML
ncbi:hypothetical protein Pelo_2476 [Pelomyxa schiedti]|nr:hypothetical protein Pelo_2476 [Pelomyxa schiedti]